jgi:2,5-furandicarboxylate decarboxylase 1
MDLRDHVKDLEAAGDLLRIRRPTSLRHVTAIAEATDKAVLFEEPAGCDTPLLVNAMATRSRWARMLGVSSADAGPELERRLTGPIEPVRVAEAPVQEIVQAGDDVDVTRLPAYLQHELDGAPYISAALDVSRDPETGRYNTGVRRLMLRGPNETGVDLVGPTDGRSNYAKAIEMGKRFEVAFVIGAHPLDYIATQLHGTGNELAFMGGIRGCAVPVVQCKTVDLEVPATAEIVLEGYLDGGWETPEGPFGEYTGCYGAPHYNPRFVITAITRRSDAIFQSATIGGRSLAHTDTAAITSLCTEVAVWASLRPAVARPVQVYCPPQATGLHHARVAIDVRDPGDARNAILAALSSKANLKHVIVVDSDIDVFSDEMVEWALSTRFQGDRDLVVVPGMRTLQLDPSLPPSARPGAPATSANVGFDATRRADKPAAVFSIPRAPWAPEPAGHPDPADGERVSDVDAFADDILGTLGGGATFVEICNRFPAAHQGDIVRALAVLSARGTLEFREGGSYVRV